VDGPEWVTVSIMASSVNRRVQSICIGIYRAPLSKG
jgi:hypothetical protein